MYIIYSYQIDRTTLVLVFLFIDTIMINLKTLNLALEEIEKDRGISRERLLETINFALASAYKRQYGKRDQIIEAKFDPETSSVSFNQVKKIVDDNMLLKEEEKEIEDEENEEKGDAKEEVVVESKEESKKDDEVEGEDEEDEDKVFFNQEQHIMIDDAKKIKSGVNVGDELRFPLEPHSDFGRIAAQNAKQIIMQKIREIEKEIVIDEFSEKEGTIVSSSVRRVEGGNIFINLKRTVAILPRNEQIHGENWKYGDIIKAMVIKVNEQAKGGCFVVLSRTHPDFIIKLFMNESQELANGSVVIKAISREAGARTKIAVESKDEFVDPVGALVGQHGMRVSAVMNEVRNERIDVIEYSDDPKIFIEDALSPARISKIELKEEENRAIVEVDEDQVSFAIGNGGQNVRMASKLTKWNIDIISVEKPDTDSEDDIDEEKMDANDTDTEEVVKRGK